MHLKVNPKAFLTTRAVLAGAWALSIGFAVAPGAAASPRTHATTTTITAATTTTTTTPPSPPQITTFGLCLQQRRVCHWAWRCGHALRGGTGWHGWIPL